MRWQLNIFRTILYGILFFCHIASAQYFGMNKPSYKQFNYELIKTPHFELYHYFTDSTLLNKLAHDCEKWYFYHQQVLTDTFKMRNPVIFYTNHADFQQTSAVSSPIDIGTGGVTEGLKRRVILPVTFLQDETDHVLGHELVHAFQYHILTESENLNLGSVQNVPLWMIEGMAEYLSIGSVSSNTALWMRDALIHKNFPTLEEMSYDYRYSPYHFGHAFWAYIASVYGEQYISRLFRTTAKYGYEQSIYKLFNISADSLSKNWEAALEKQLITEPTDTIYPIIGTRILYRGNSGRYNISPSVSPNGKYIIFLSERDVYSLDLFLADAHNGEIKKRIYTSTRYDEIDALSLLETSGTWSPDSKQFAYVGYSKGETILIIFDVSTNKIISELKIPEVDAMSSPAWNPMGGNIAFIGMKNGISDIYIYDLNSKTTENITNSKSSCVMPTWTADGKNIYYTSDQPTTNQSNLSFPFTNIAVINIETGENKLIQTFDGAKNTNPIPTKNSSNILFISDRDGRRNLYSYDTINKEIDQLTHYPTGISGISEYAPTISSCGDTLVYSMLWDGEFSLYRTNWDQLSDYKTKITSRTANYSASRLMPYSAYPSMVETNLFFDRQPYKQKADSFYLSQIQPKFKLDYIGNMSAGVMAGRFGTGMAGSIEAMFSDILGYHKLYTGVSINGEIYDFGGQIAYINQKRRLKKGVSVSHIPYRTGSVGYELDTLSDGSIESSTSYLFRRIFEDKVSAFTFFPINKTKRIEFGLSYAYFSYRDEKVENVYSYDQLYYGKKEKVQSPTGFHTGIIDAAYVIDNSKFGIASPVEGKRIRLQMEQYLMDFNMYTVLVDYRKYFFIKPYSLALRLYHYGRYGTNSSSNRFSNLYLGYPWYIRGYESGYIYGDESVNPNTISINQLIGSRLIVTNFEWRIPFTGPPEMAIFHRGSFLSEIALFFDAGLSWDDQSSPVFSLSTRSQKNRIPLFSTGVAYRINLFGVMIIEPYYAFPIHQRQIKRGSFGMNFFSGW